MLKINGFVYFGLFRLANYIMIWCRRYIMKSSHKNTLVLAGVSALVALLVVPLMTSSHIDEPKARAEDKSVVSSQTRTVIVAGNQDPQFSPMQLRIKAGDSVEFFNVDGADGVGRAHRVISIDAGSGIPNADFDTGILSMGEKSTITLSEPGVYGFVDILWPATRGAIIVEP